MIILKNTFLIIFFVFVSLICTSAFADEFDEELTRWQGIDSKSLSGVLPQLRVLVISDMNMHYGSMKYGLHTDRVLEHIAKSRIEGRGYDLVLCAGGMVAGQKQSLNDSRIKAMWDSFNSYVLKPLEKQGIPFAFTLGNHDASASKGYGRERREATIFWKENKPELIYHDEAQFPFQYSFSMAGVMFVILDASLPGLTIRQQDWLFSVLRTDAAQNAKSIVVMGQLPFYAISEGRNHRGAVLQGGDKLLQRMAMHGVDYYISGHHQAFYLSEKHGVKMLFAGALGDSPRRYIGSERKPVRTAVRMDLFEDAHDFRIHVFDMDERKLLGSPMEEIFPAELPAFVDGFNGRVKMKPWRR